jgi:hypothetical protein
MGTIVGTFSLSRLGNDAFFTLNLGKRRSDQFTVTHLFTTSKLLRRVQNQIVIKTREPHLAGMCSAEHGKLAGCGHSIWTKIEPYCKTLQGMTLMLHKRE